MKIIKIFNICMGIVLALSATSINAAVTMTLTEVGGNVVATASGTLNITDLSLAVTTNDSGGINPSFAFLEVAPFGGGGSKDVYTNVSGPTSFGTGGYRNLGSGTGDRFGIRAVLGAGVSAVTVPNGYVSGDPLSGSATFNGADFGSLGVNPGTYTWTWGTGRNADSLTLLIGTPSAIPTLSPWALIILAGLLGLFGITRRLT